MPSQLPSVEPESTTMHSTLRLARAVAQRVQRRGQAARAVVVDEDHGELRRAAHAAVYWQGCRGRSILLVAQLTPPSPLSGARRPAALAKYLPRRGHRVTVLTSLASGRGEMPAPRGYPHARRAVKPPELAPRPLQAMQGQRAGGGSEASPLEEIVVPDLGWPAGCRSRCRGRSSLARAERVDCVITTSPPQSAHLIGAGPPRRPARPGSPTCATAGPSTRRDGRGRRPLLDAADRALEAAAAASRRPASSRSPSRSPRPRAALGPRSR